MIGTGNVAAMLALAPLGIARHAEPKPADVGGSSVEALLALSRDATGCAHIERAAFLTTRGIAGTLRMSPCEVSDLRHVLALRDYTPLRARGLHVEGRKFVFIRESEGGRVFHAVRPAEFLTVRAADEHAVIALSREGMLHNRAIEAVYQYVRRHSAEA